MSETNIVAYIGPVAGTETTDGLGAGTPAGVGVSPQQHRQLQRDDNPLARPNRHAFPVLTEEYMLTQHSGDLIGELASISVETATSRTPNSGALEEKEISVVDLNWTEGALWFEAATKLYAKAGKSELFPFSNTSGAFAIFRHNEETKAYDFVDVVSDELPHEMVILYRALPTGGTEIKYGLYRKWVQDQKYGITQSIYFKPGKPQLAADGVTLKQKTIPDLDYTKLVQVYKAAKKQLAGQELNEDEENLADNALLYGGQVANPILRCMLLFDERLASVPDKERGAAIAQLEKDPILKNLFLESAARAMVMYKLSRNKSDDGWRIGAVLGAADLKDETHGLRKGILAAAKLPEDPSDQAIEPVHGSFYYSIHPGSRLPLTFLFNNPNGPEESTQRGFVPAFYQHPHAPYAHRSEVLTQFDGKSRLRNIKLAGYVGHLTIPCDDGVQHKVEECIVVNLRQAPGVIARAITTPMGPLDPWRDEFNINNPFQPTLEDMLHRRGPFMHLGKGTPIERLVGDRLPVGFAERVSNIGKYALHEVLFRGQETALFGTPQDADQQRFRIKTFGLLTKGSMRNLVYRRTSPEDYKGMKRVMSFWINHHDKFHYDVEKGFDHVTVKLPSPRTAMQLTEINQ